MLFSQKSLTSPPVCDFEEFSVIFNGTRSYFLPLSEHLTQRLVQNRWPLRTWSLNARLSVVDRVGA